MEDGLKISELTQASSISNADLIPIVQNNETKSVSLIDMIYPIGSIYMSVNSVNPSTLFGGTWVQIKDTFLLSAGDSYTAGNTGGEATHTLVANELPNITGSIKFSANIVKNDNDGSIVESTTGAFSKNSNNSVTSVNSSVTNPTLWYFNQVDMSFGNNQAHNNMPPYLVVYVWKRTA